MRRSLAAALTAFTLVKAQSVADLPACSLQCFATAVAATTCGPTDYACQCTPSNKQIITDSVTPCLTKSTCSITQLQKIQQFAQAFCPQIIASASAHPTSQPTSSGSVIPSQSPSSATAAVINLSSAAPASPTSSTVSLQDWGANYPGTNWQSATSDSQTTRGPAVEGVSIALFIVASCVVGFRLYARLRTKRLRQVSQGLGWDEFFACVTLAFTGGVLGTVIVGVRHGMGKHQDYQSAAEWTTLIKSVYVFTILIDVCFCALKVSILCLYFRMTPKRSHHITIYVVMCVVVAHAIATTFGNIFQCYPISDYWNITKIYTNTMGCVDLITMDIFNSAWSAFENIIIWLMPIPVVWKLKVRRERKAGLYSLIGVSFIAIIASWIRVSALVLWVRSSDISWNYPLIPLLCMIQTCVALITSSLPAIYPLLRKPPPEPLSRRPSRVPADPNADREKAWNSQGSTLNSSKGDRRSRWSFSLWNGHRAPKVVRNVPELPKEADEEASSVEVEKAAPVTQHKMIAYVSSGEEARGMDGHRRMFEADEESLTVPRIYMRGTGYGDDYGEIGYAR